jgi:hypothetical protein
MVRRRRPLAHELLLQAQAIKGGRGGVEEQEQEQDGEGEVQEDRCVGGVIVHIQKCTVAYVSSTVTRGAGEKRERETVGRPCLEYRS